ncbi:MAG: hypothetical protein F6J97_14380 [Leptolyngbya sp. SIO4C1]|nr:hypothetical protein [Leptolyngbya sp. SIO4C1]
MKIFKALHPMFWLALGLHAALLFIPISGSSDDAVPPPDLEEDTIAVTRVPPEPSAQPATPPAVAPLPAAAVRRASQAEPASSAAQPASAAQPSQPRVSSPASTAPTTARRSVGQGVPELPPASESAPPRPPQATEAASPAVQEPLTLAALAKGATGSVPNRLTQLLDWFGRLYTYRPEKTTAEATAAAKSAWLSAVRARTGLATLESQSVEPPVGLRYPLEKDASLAYERNFVACLSETPQSALVGVDFDAAEEMAADPALLRSTGYEFLDQEAIARASQQGEFPSQKAQKAYTVEVVIDYDAERCFGLD